MTTVYVICPDHDSPSGDIIRLYELVDILNKYSIKSFIIHHRRDFKIAWFKNSTPVKYIDSADITDNDLIIIPEVYGNNIMDYFSGVRKIIFNQNVCNTLEKFYGDMDKAKSFYLHQDVVQVMVVSENDFYTLEWIFPDIKLSRIYNSINEELFYYNPNKSKTIAFMPAKELNEYNLLVDILHLKNVLDGYSIKRIDKLSVEECAEVMREAVIFLSFSMNAGFSDHLAEAMACGCIVIGYHGQGGKEFFKEDLTYEIQPSDIIEFSKSVKEIIDEFNVKSHKIGKTGQRASEFILKKYSQARQEKSILKVISQFIV